MEKPLNVSHNSLGLSKLSVSTFNYSPSPKINFTQSRRFSIESLNNQKNNYDYESVFPADAQSLDSNEPCVSPCNNAQEDNLLLSSQLGKSDVSRENEVSEIFKSNSISSELVHKNGFSSQKHLRLESMTTHDSHFEGNRDYQEQSNISAISSQSINNIRQDKEFREKHNLLINRNNNDSTYCSDYEEEPEQILTPKIYSRSRSTSPLQSEQKTSDSRLESTLSETIAATHVPQSSYSIMSKASEPTCEFITQFLEIAGRNFDDNPKFWNKLRIFLQEQQSLLHKRTQELEEAKRKTRCLEDELGSTLQNLRRLENQKHHNEKFFSNGFPQTPILDSPMNSTKNTVLATNTRIDIIANLKQDFQKKIDEKNNECLSLIQQLEDMRDRLNQAEMRCSELETETNFIIKERDLWKTKTRNLKDSEKNLEDEVSRLKKALAEVHQTFENTYGETLCKLRKTITKQQNQLSALEETVQKQSNLDDYQDLLETKEELETQIVEQQAEIHQLEKISSVYQQEHSRLEQIDDRAGSLERELEEKKNALRQLQKMLQVTKDEKMRLEEVLEYVNTSMEKEVLTRDEAIENYENVIENLKFQLQNEQASLESKQIEYLALEDEANVLRKECKKLQKLLREQTASALTEIEKLNAKLQTADEICHKDLITEVEKREERFREEMDSMIELRTNQRVEAIRSKYENRIARLKHHLMHKHSNSHHNKLDLKKLIASEIAKYTNLNDPWRGLLPVSRTEKTIGSATASSWQPVTECVNSDSVLEVNKKTREITLES